MATSAKVGPQDMPPPGGYNPIQTDRVKLRSIIGWKVGMAVFAVTNVMGFIGFGIEYRRRKRELMEMRSASFALTPLLVAERDRAFLKQVISNRDEETELMKDYPGWEVGKYFDEPVFFNQKEDEFKEPRFQELTCHGPPDSSILNASVQVYMD